MRQLTLRMDATEYADLSKIAQKYGFKTMSKAIKFAIKTLVNEPKNDITLDASRAQVATLPINKESISEDSDELHNSRSFIEGKNIQKKPPPQDLPENWEPPAHLRENYCKQYGLVYARAIEMFRDLVNDESRRSSNWQATWCVKVKRGALKHLQPEEDGIQPEDTMAYQLGNAGRLDYLRRG